MKSKVKILLVCVLLGLVVGNFAAAAIVNCGGRNANGTAQNPCTIGDLIGTIRLIINTLLSWAWLICVLFIVIAGFRMIFSGGNEETVSVAKTTLRNAIVGFIIILVSFVILNFTVALLTGSAGNPRAIFDAFDLVPNNK